ncbi:MAG TPA: very short patch repair endonuclease [Verrucomicrobiae bacterium]|nr:very short patch repair endonuclease [Verrucomicrobiae bacterium]
MPDVFNKRKRSKVMAAIRSSGNKATELKLVEIFRLYGIKGWQRKRRLVGKPDFIFPKERMAIFVDGCFWHGCRFHCRMPKSRLTYWTPKIIRNRRRDAEIGKQLRKLGWRVLRIWEHSLKNPERIAIRLHAMLGNAPQNRLNVAKDVNASTHSAKI